MYVCTLWIEFESSLKFLETFFRRLINLVRRTNKSVRETQETCGDRNLPHQIGHRRVWGEADITRRRIER